MLKPGSPGQTWMVGHHSSVVLNRGMTLFPLSRNKAMSGDRFGDTEEGELLLAFVGSGQECC